MQEEDRIITAEEAGLKKSMGDRTLTGRKLKEYLLRIVYAEVRARGCARARSAWRSSFRLTRGYGGGHRVLPVLRARICAARGTSSPPRR